MRVEYEEFREDMIPEAGQLLARRHAANRRQQPLLPKRFEDPLIATQAVHAVWHKKSSQGYAAFCDGSMVAYLIGEQVMQPWGRCGYVYLPGYTLSEDQNVRAIQDLYGLLGDDWVKDGCMSHGLYICAEDRHVIGSLFNLGFGKERVDALLELSSLTIPELEPPEGLAVRQAGAGDNDNLANLSDIIARALSDAPYWHPALPEDFTELREGWAELADDKEWTVWMALENGHAVGCAGFRPEWEADSQMLAAPGTIYLSVAATKPETRGRGISTYLTWRGLEHAQKEGYRFCYTNWISANLLAARHWPRYGFRDVAYRLSKRVDPMSAWGRV